MKRLVVILSLLIFLSSCKSYQDVMYIQDVPIDTQLEIQGFKELTIQPGDLISIIVSSKVPELAVHFNLPMVTYQSGSDMQYASQRMLGYSVDLDGNIDFPTLGKISVQGLTKIQLSEKIKDALITASYINDPIVTVQFLNFKIHVIGEVTHPGTYNFSGNYFTILEAVGMAGDLTVYGRRDNIKVIRESDGERIVYSLDLRSANIFNSPAYYLQQNDVVYVEPNRYKASQSNNAKQFAQVGLWISLASLIATVTMLIIK